MREPSASLSYFFAAVLLSAPALSQYTPTRLTAADATPGAQLGAVALDADTLLVGAPGASASGPESGAVHVFERTPNGWLETGVLTPDDAEAGASFGSSVALEGGRAVVSAPFAESATLEAGALYVFERGPEPGGRWTQVARLSALDGFVYDTFGGVLDMSGERIVVGAVNDDDAGKSSGAAYVFEKFGPVWVQTAKLLPEDGAEFQRFGSSVAIDGDRVVVGATGDSEAGLSAGAAYLFLRTATGWVTHGKLVSPEPGTLAYFGSTVELDAGTLLVGERGYDGIESNAGAVHVYGLDAAHRFSRTQVLTSSAPASLGKFGGALSLRGERLLIGAPREEHGDVAGGAIHLYRREGAEWVRIERLGAALPESFAFLGANVALDADGSTLVAGAPLEDVAAADAGAVHVFERQELAIPYCFCAANAPCGNVDGDGGCMNSTLRGARLEAVGSTRVAADDLVLRVTGLPRHQSAVLFMGGGEAQLPLGDGLRCVDWGGIGMFRFDLHDSGAEGALSEGPGLVQYSAEHFGVLGGIDAGETWYVQALFRDGRGACGVGVNLSNAVALTFLP